jgi:hypothetical protein
MIFLATLTLAALAQDAPRSEGPPPLIELVVDPLSDLWMWVRAAGEQGVRPPPGAEGCCAAAAAAARELPHPLAWGPIEGHLAHARDAAELVERLEGLPESFALGPRTLPLRAPALELARAFAAEEPALRAALWPAHREALEAAAGELGRELAGRDGALGGLLGAHLGLARPERPVPVHLVARAPHPGAVTHRSGPRQGVSFAGLEDLAGTQRLEVVLHESLHALDVRSEEDVLDALREALAAAGLDARSPLLRDLPHAVLFAEAAELVRRTGSPEHEDYASQAGVYRRMGPAAEATRALWLRHLAGELGRDEALAAIVEAARSASAR